MNELSNLDNMRKADGETAVRMTEAAAEFMSSLSEEKRKSVLFSIDDPERMNWDYRPRDRNGLSLKRMDSNLKKKAFKLLSESLSRSGHEKAIGIMELENILDIVEEKSGGFDRDPELYYISMFGNPGKESTWGWRIEGHHLSVNYLVVNGRYLAFAPSFFGANPAKIPEGLPNAGFRVLAGEEDVARNLLNKMDSRTRENTIFSERAPADIVTRWKPRVRMDDPAGTPFSNMEKSLQSGFGDLLNVYLGRMPMEVADERMNRIEKEGKKYIHFAWAGSSEPGNPHYYRIHGPSFLIEYDNVQNKANHIHTVWRDIGNDWGEDLLRDHYKRSHHKKG